MLREFFESALKLKRNEIVTTEEKEFILPEYVEVSKKEPVVSILELKTLTGLVSYIKDEIDKNDICKGSFVHVSEYNHVRLVSEIFGSQKQRECFVSSHFSDDCFNESWSSTENFIINVNSMFKHTNDYEYLMSIVSGLSSEASKGVKDNGMSQTAVVKTGITVVGECEIKNPITLQPFKTFPEIDQPLIDYVFRLRDREGGSINCALFECDGGMWKLNTVHAIRDYLMKELEGTNVKIIA